MVFALNITAQINDLTWHHDFEEAKQLSKTQDKPVLLYFTGSDWCSPCKKLKADFFNSERFREQADAFVLVMVDLPRRNGLITPEQKRKNMLLMQDYNKRGSFPTLVGLNADGKVLGDIIGYGRNIGTDGHFAFLEKILKQY
jgi:thioredoxin-related protein